MKEIKTFFASGNRLNKGYGRLSNPREMDNSFYRKKFEHILPPLDVMSEYEAMNPGTLARLIDMAEKEQHHRHALDFATLENSQRSIKRGQCLAIILGVFLAITTILLSLFCSSWAVVAFTVLAFLPMSLTSILSSIKSCKNKSYNGTKDGDNISNASCHTKRS